MSLMQIHRLLRQCRRCSVSIIKTFINDSITSNPTRYGGDGGDLNIINDYFESQGWQSYTREQHTAIAACLRYRNYFLQENETYDHRSPTTAAYEHVGQTSIYDFMDLETAVQSKKLVWYWSTHPDMIDKSNSRIKKSVRGVDTDHIIAARVMYSLLATDPLLKQKRVRKSRNVGDSDKARADSGLVDVFKGDKETNISGVTDV